MASEVKRIPLDRRVCVVKADRIDLRPERGALIGPVLGLFLGAVLFTCIVLFASDLSMLPLVLMLLGAVLITPLSAMGFVYSLVGAAVVVEKDKQSVRFQQGLLGLGIGTVELVPFWKIDRIEVTDCQLGDIAPSGPRPPLDFRAWDIVLLKKSGKRLSIGQVVSANAPDLIDEGFNRALDAAEAIAAMTAAGVLITAEIEEAATESVALAPSPADAAEERGRAEPAAG